MKFAYHLISPNSISVHSNDFEWFARCVGVFYVLHNCKLPVVTDRSDPVPDQLRPVLTGPTRSVSLTG